MAINNNAAPEWLKAHLREQLYGRFTSSHKSFFEGLREQMNNSNTTYGYKGTREKSPETGEIVNLNITPDMSVLSMTYLSEKIIDQLYKDYRRSPLIRVAKKHLHHALISLVREAKRRNKTAQLQLYTEGRNIVARAKGDS